MDAKTEELRAAHDVLAELYAERLAGALVQPGGYLVTAFKAGDGQLRRGGHSTGLGV